MNRTLETAWTRENFYTHPVFNFALDYLNLYSNTYRAARAEFRESRLAITESLSKADLRRFTRWEEAMTQFHNYACHVAFTEGQADYRFLRAGHTRYNSTLLEVGEHFAFDLQLRIYSHVNMSDSIFMHITQRQFRFTQGADDYARSGFRHYSREFERAKDMVFPMIYLSALELGCCEEGPTKELAEMRRRIYEYLGLEQVSAFQWENYTYVKPKSRQVGG